MQRWKRMLSGGFMTLVGYLLSPLSWWNDAFVNLPLAIAFAWMVSFFYKPAFETSLIVGYWLTNVVGFILIHKGGERMLSAEEKRYSWKNIGKDMLISLMYTGLIVVLVKMNVLQPLGDYLKGRGH